MKNVLVVDDDRESAVKVEAALLAAQQQVVRVHTATEAFSLLKEQQFNVVITDILMPNLQGFDLIINLNNSPQKPRIIVTTGGPSKLGVKYLSKVAESLKVRHIMEKPLDMDKLLELVTMPEEPPAITVQAAVGY